ncbi:unnamed protein product [Scytosiphon promiscuus]
MQRAGGAGEQEPRGLKAGSIAAISCTHTMHVTSHALLPRSSPVGPPVQRCRGKTLPARCRGPTPRCSARSSSRARLGLSLLMVLAGLPTVLAEPNAVIELQPGRNTVLPSITENATCEDWAAWVPQRSEPAVVMQVVSQDYIPIQQNFIRLMERNSCFTRHNLYLMCIDDASKSFFEEHMGIQCVPMSALDLLDHKDIWKLRVRVLSCLVRIGRVDVIMSDADALWINDPTPELFHSGRSRTVGDGSSHGDKHDRRKLSTVDVFGGSDHRVGRRQQTAGGSAWHDVRDSDVVASRGSFPGKYGRVWGSTMCMGFILLRAGNVAGMAAFLGVVEDFVMKTQDDQISINTAAAKLGIVWDTDSDMRYDQSTRYGMGEIPVDGLAAAAAAGYGGDSSGRAAFALGDANEGFLPLKVTLLPHSTYTRLCDETLVSERTVVAHCFDPAKVASVKTSWMESMGLWSVENDP